MASVDLTIARTVASASLAKIAWDLLYIAYVNKRYSTLQLARLVAKHEKGLQDSCYLPTGDQIDW